MPVSECRFDDMPLVRLEYPTYTGHLGMIAPHGASFLDGVAQNGVTEAAAVRLCGAIGPSLRVVGPWLDAPPAPSPIAGTVLPAGGDAPSAPEAPKPEPFARTRRR